MGYVHVYGCMYIIGSTWFPQINVLFIKCKRLLVVSRGLIQSPLYSCYFFSQCVYLWSTAKSAVLSNCLSFAFSWLHSLFAGWLVLLFVRLVHKFHALTSTCTDTQTHTLTYYIHKIFFSLTSFSWFSLRPCWIQPQAHSHIQCTISITKVFDVLVHHLRSTTHVHTKLLSFVSFPWRNTVHRKRDVCLRCRNSYTSITHRVGKVFDRACAALC